MKLKISKLSKNYGTKNVLKNVNIEFEEGKIYGLLGRNGAGKTTFFNVVNQDILFDDGEIFFDELPEEKSVLTDEIGYITATPVVPEFLTGREFLKFYIDINKTRVKDLKDIDYYCDLVKLDKDDQNKLLKEYSHGMKNKIQILINIIANPKIILLDEPMTSLDIVVQEEMKSLLKQLKKDHIIILSTHIFELAEDLCDEIVVLSNNKMTLIDKKEKKYKDRIMKLLKEDNHD